MWAYLCWPLLLRNFEANQHSGGSAEIQGAVIIHELLSCKDDLWKHLIPCSHRFTVEGGLKVLLATSIWSDSKLNLCHAISTDLCNGNIQTTSATSQPNNFFVISSPVLRIHVALLCFYTLYSLVIIQLFCGKKKGAHLHKKKETGTLTFQK